MYIDLISLLQLATVLNGFSFSCDSPLTISKSFKDIFVKNLYLFVSNVVATLPVYILQKTVKISIANLAQTPSELSLTCSVS